MVGDRGWPISFIQGMLEAYGHAIDIAKVSAWHLHQPEHIVKRKVEIYKAFSVEPQIGGPVLEIAEAQGKMRETLAYLRELGFEGLEVSSESKPTTATVEEDAAFIKLAREFGFRIHGEVGKKFPEGDRTRRSPTEVNIEETVKQFQNFVDHGAENVYWEGHLLRMVLGDNGERVEGRAVVEEVARRVGVEHIIFEVPFTYLPYASKRALQALLVYMFGPEVNIGNVLIEELPELEEIRGGTFPAFGAPAGDHPWLASLIRGGGKAAPDWWRGK
jgi:phosphosulfolactate synthase